MTNKNKGKIKKNEKEKVKPVPPEVTEERQRMAYHMRMIGVPRLTLSEITEELNKKFPAYPLKSDHEAVRKMIKRQQEIYATQDKDKLEEIRAETSAILDFTRDEAIKAWEESKGIAKTVKKKVEKPIEQTLKESTGEPQFLKIVESTTIEKAKLFGVVAPKRLEHAGPGGGPIPVQPFDMEEWKRLRQERIDKVKKLEK